MGETGAGMNACIVCATEIDVGWEQHGKEVSCPKCGKRYYVGWEEGYNSETGEEWGYFILEPP